MVIALIGTDLKMCLNHTFNSGVLIQKAYDLVFEKVEKMNFPHILTGKNENTIVTNNNKMSRPLNSTKDGLFCLQNTVGGKGKGTLIKMTCVFLAEVMTTHVIQYKICHIHIIASRLLLCQWNYVLLMHPLFM